MAHRTPSVATHHVRCARPVARSSPTPEARTLAMKPTTQACSLLTRSTILILSVSPLVGCATSNYDFAKNHVIHGNPRAQRLASDLSTEKENGKDDDLYDFEMVPLAYTHLNVFAESNEDGIPNGFVEADIESYLPFFGVVDATISRYGSDHQLYEHHEFDSYLWGMFRRHREKVVTTVGTRQQSGFRVLWLFGWDSSPTYTLPEAESPQRVATTLD